MTQSRGPFNPGKAISPAKLQDELIAASIPVTGISYASATAITIYYTDLATSQQMNGDTDTVITAHTAATPVQTYTTAFYANRKVIFNAFYTFSEAFRTASASPSLAQYRSALGSTLAIILTLPASFTDELAREQAGLALPNGPTSGWTLANCQGWHTLLSGWLGRAMAGVAGALAGDLD